MKKLFLYISIVLFFFNTVQALPKCEGPTITWTNCQGTILNKYIGSPDDEIKTTRDFTGEFGSFPGRRDGKGLSKLYRDGKLIFTYFGQFKNGFANGKGTEIHPDGHKYVGEWKDGTKNGQGTYIWPNGDKYVGEWKDGTKNGQGTSTYSNGDIFVGEYKDSKRHGQGTMTYSNGDKYVGEYNNGVRHGQGTYTFLDGTVYEGEWKNGEYSNK